MSVKDFNQSLRFSIWSMTDDRLLFRALTKQRNLLSPSSIDKIMRLVLLGPHNFDDDTWEQLVDDYRDAKDCRTVL